MTPATNLIPVNSADNDFGYGQLFAILIRRRFWLLGGLVVATGLGAFMTWRQPPTYISGMQLLIAPNYQGKQQKPSPEFADTTVEVDTATQINLMQSSGLLQRAAKLLEAEYPEFGPQNPSALALIKGGLTVAQLGVESGGKKSETATKIFGINYTDNDPGRAQAVLRALKKVYLDYNLEQQRLRLDKGLAFINEQLPQIRQQVKGSESALERFRRTQELIDPANQAKAQEDAINALQREQQVNQVQLKELQSRYTELQNQLALNPQQARLAARVSQSGRFQSLLNEIQKSELILVQQRLRFKDNMPQVQQVLDQRKKQLDLLQIEVNRVLGGNAGQVAGQGESLLAQGQLAGIDLSLVGQLVEAEVNLQAASARFNSLNQAEAELRGELQRFPRLLAEYGRLQPEVDLNRETLRQLLKARQDLGLEIARGGFDWQIVEEPQFGYQTGPDLRRNLLLGAVAGLFLGGVAAFLREAADDAIHSSNELEKQVAVPLLGVIPALTQEPEGGALGLPFGRSPVLTSVTPDVIQWQPFREALDLLYQNIQLLNADHALKSLMVTSALAGEGKSTLALGLAISAARLHKRVLLVDADLRRPSLHKLLDLPNDRGLSTLLANDDPVPTRIGARAANLRSNISVVTAGPPPADPAKLLSSHRMREIMATFERSYDLVVLDAPPVLGMVDTMLVGSRCQGVILVGRIEQVTRTELNRAIAASQRLNVVGIVANGSTSPLSNAAYYQTSS
jgi:polysaccharide biosynthesis transport protein